MKDITKKLEGKSQTGENICKSHIWQRIYIEIWKELFSSVTQ